mgnify:CR=1 FL=1
MAIFKLPYGQHGAKRSCEFWFVKQSKFLATKDVNSSSWISTFYAKRSLGKTTTRHWQNSTTHRTDRQCTSFGVSVHWLQYHCYKGNVAHHARLRRGCLRAWLLSQRREHAHLHASGCRVNTLSYAKVINQLTSEFSKKLLNILHTYTMNRSQNNSLSRYATTRNLITRIVNCVFLHLSIYNWPMAHANPFRKRLDVLIRQSTRGLIVRLELSLPKFSLSWSFNCRRTKILIWFFRYRLIIHRHWMLNLSSVRFTRHRLYVSRIQVRQLESSRHIVRTIDS